MEDQRKEISMTPIEALSYCRNRLDSIPITVDQIDTIGKPIKEVINLLELLKQAILAPSEIREERTI